MVQLVAALLVVLQSNLISGVVRDTSGGVVADAVILVQRADFPAEPVTTTGPDGRFRVDVGTAGAPVTLIVRAGGFAERDIPLSGRETGDVAVVMQPAA